MTHLQLLFYHIHEVTNYFCGGCLILWARWIGFSTNWNHPHNLSTHNWLHNYQGVTMPWVYRLIQILEMIMWSKTRGITHDHLHMERKIRGVDVKVLIGLLKYAWLEKSIGSKIALKEVNLDQLMGGHAPQLDKTSIMGLYHTF